MSEKIGYKTLTYHGWIRFEKIAALVKVLIESSQLHLLLIWLLESLHC